MTCLPEGDTANRFCVRRGSAPSLGLVAGHIGGVGYADGAAAIARYNLLALPVQAVDLASVTIGATNLVIIVGGKRRVRTVTLNYAAAQTLGATIGIFPIDEETLKYLRFTARDDGRRAGRRRGDRQ
mgnify:CR=1 FL=1